MFFRSAAWCPHCQAQLIDVNGGVAEIEKRGYRVAGLSYDQPKVLADFTEKRQIGYTFLSDPKSEVIDRYNSRDPKISAGQLRLWRATPDHLHSRHAWGDQGEAVRGDIQDPPLVAAVIAQIDGLGATP